MNINSVTKYLKLANVQMASESLFTERNFNPTLIPVGASSKPSGRFQFQFDQSSLQYGNRRASVFTPTLAAEFTNNLQHQGMFRVKLFCAVPT